MKRLLVVFAVAATAAFALPGTARAGIEVTTVACGSGQIGDVEAANLIALAGDIKARLGC